MYNNGCKQTSKFVNQMCVDREAFRIYTICIANT